MPWILVATGLVAVGTALAVVGVTGRRTASRRARRWTTVHGEIVARRTVWLPGGPNEPGSLTELVEVEYRGADGRVRRLSAPATDQERAEAAQTVTVHVDPTDPDLAAVLSGPLAQQRDDARLLAAGLLLTLGGAVMALLLVAGILPG